MGIPLYIIQGIYSSTRVYSLMKVHSFLLDLGSTDLRIRSCLRHPQLPDRLEGTRKVPLCKGSVKASYITRSSPIRGLNASDRIPFDDSFKGFTRVSRWGRGA